MHSDPHHPAPSSGFEEEKDPAATGFEVAHNLAFSINQYPNRSDGLTPEVKEGLSASGNLEPPAGSMPLGDMDADPTRSFAEVERLPASDGSDDLPTGS